MLKLKHIIDSNELKAINYYIHNHGYFVEITLTAQFILSRILMYLRTCEFWDEKNLLRNDCQASSIYSQLIVFLSLFVI